MQNKAKASVIIILLMINSPQAAEISGFAGLDVRLFTETPAFNEQNSSFADPSVFIQPEFRHEWRNGAERFTAIPFARYDSLDTYRTHWDVREFNWLHQGDNWSVQTGISKVFWGVTESHHLIDIINQTDFVENINAEEKLGQPMLNLNIPSAYGNFNFLYLPYFRERTFSAANGRLRFELPIESKSQDLNGQSHWHPDWAVRWSKTFGDWDLGIAHFNGISREPRLVPRFADGNFINPTAPPTLIPSYDLIHQTSLDLQGALGNWLLKLEAMTRSGQGDRFGAVVAGFEYTHYGIFDSSADLGLLSEFQYDNRKQLLRELNPLVPPTAADNDIFLGARLAFNDTQNSQILMGSIIDVKTQATVFSVEASRRIGDNWKLELESRVFTNIPENDILAGYRNDDYVQLRVIRYLSDLMPSSTIKDTQLAASVQNIQAQQLKGHTADSKAKTNTTTLQPNIQQKKAVENDVLARLQQWANAWSAGNIIDYFSFYQPDFKPDYKTSHDTWKTIRISRVKPNRGIRVALADIKAHFDPVTNTVVTVFKQNYQSNNYGDVTFKQLMWRKINDQWLISEEKSLETLPLSLSAAAIPSQGAAEDHGVVDRLMSWAQAWSKGDVDDYLNYYQADFQSEESSSHDEWVSIRKQRIHPDKDIRVNISNINTKIDTNANQMITTFNQHYRSNAYHDKVKKQIVWKKENGQWQIINEKSLIK